MHDKETFKELATFYNGRVAFLMPVEFSDMINNQFNINSEVEDFVDDGHLLEDIGFTLDKSEGSIVYVHVDADASVWRNADTEDSEGPYWTPIHPAGLAWASSIAEVPNVHHAVFSLQGVDFHAEAIEVESESSTEAVNPQLQNRIEGVQHFDGPSDSYSTLEIGGKPHFVIIHPYQQ